jgi:hypothetical protein
MRGCRKEVASANRVLESGAKLEYSRRSQKGGVMLISSFTKPPVRLKARRHTLNERYFDTLGPAQAYWLGYLAADGCVSVRSRNGTYAFVLGLSSKDYEHLDKFRSALKTTFPVHGPHSGCYQVIITSYDLCLALERYGIVPRKSLTFEPPKLPEDLERHWARGVVDGDGCFNSYHRPSRAVKRNGRGRPAGNGQDIFVLNVAGSLDMIMWFYDRFGGSFRPHGNVWNWSVTGQMAIDVVHWLYADSKEATRLDRKYANAVRLVNFRD